MATLLEYFEKDFSNTLSINRDFDISESGGKTLMKVIARAHLNLTENSLFVSYYIPRSSIACSGEVIIGSIQELLRSRKDIYVASSFAGSSSEVLFTGRIFIYSENEVTQENLDILARCSTDLGYKVIIRSKSYVAERVKWDVPLAFISHDSRDKKQLAEPLAIALQGISCSVWYDEYSLKVGDSLREGIEKGLRECKKCIFLITPNFLVNGGWTKLEYDSIFTRELIEDRKLILPVWYGVTKKEVYQYSPILADRVAVIWDGDIKNIANRLRQSII
jgi:hypothetical protein